MKRRKRITTRDNNMSNEHVSGRFTLLCVGNSEIDIDWIQNVPRKIYDKRIIRDIFAVESEFIIIIIYYTIYRNVLWYLLLCGMRVNENSNMSERARKIPFCFE